MIYNCQSEGEHEAMYNYRKCCRILLAQIPPINAFLKILSVPANAMVYPFLSQLKRLAEHSLPFSAYYSLHCLSNPLLHRANLSEDYFTDRQDRYISFSQSPKLTDYFSTLAQTIAAHSYTVQPDGALVPMLSFNHLSSDSAAQKYRKLFSNAIQQELIPSDESEHLEAGLSSVEPQNVDPGFDTVVYPLLQMGYYGIHQEETATRKLLEGLGREERLRLASGYFNLPPQYTTALLQAEGSSSVLAASPQVGHRHSHQLALLACLRALLLAYIIYV